MKSNVNNKEKNTNQYYLSLTALAFSKAAVKQMVADFGRFIS
jgi:hypothetical protein